jgi:hypothetical protein
VTHASRRVKDLNIQHMDHKQDRAESSQSKLGNKRVLHELNIRAKFKATYGNLMNLLDLA